MPLPPVPEDDELTIEGHWLGPGGRVHQLHGWTTPPVPVAWITDDVRPSAGLTWAGLSLAAVRTGLQPILLSGLGGSTRRPWDEGEFGDPEDAAAIDGYDAAETLRECWGGVEPDDEQFEGESPEWVAEYLEKFKPYGAEFPGLAPASTDREDPRQLEIALGQLTPDARIGLVPAGRPADVLASLGWEGTTNRGWPAAQVSAVLRSWEDRFGARLLEVGFASIRLLVSRPPHTLEAALPLAAEHQAFCSECGRRGLTDVSLIADALVDVPFWDFWWD
jgi:Domain of unknown function (DUF4253)